MPIENVFARMMQLLKNRPTRAFQQLKKGVEKIWHKLQNLQVIVILQIMAQHVMQYRGEQIIFFNQIQIP